MTVFDIPLNSGTALAAVVALGVAVDDTIHLINRYRQGRREGRSPDDATAFAIRSQVLPVTATSISLAACFAMLTLSDLTVVGDLGMLCAFAILLALPSDLMLTPVLLKRFADPKV
jgi:predicted RND superfamily exporter protein